MMLDSTVVCRRALGCEWGEYLLTFGGRGGASRTYTRTAEKKARCTYNAYDGISTVIVRQYAIAALYCTKQTVPMSSAVALSEPSIDSRLLAGSATSCSSEAHACGVMSLPCKWQRRRVLVWASDADLDGSRWWGCGGAVSGR